MSKYKYTGVNHNDFSIHTSTAVGFCVLWNKNNTPYIFKYRNPKVKDLGKFSITSRLQYFIYKHLMPNV